MSDRLEQFLGRQRGRSQTLASPYRANPLRILGDGLEDADPDDQQADKRDQQGLNQQPEKRIPPEPERLRFNKAGIVVEGQHSFQAFVSMNGQGIDFHRHAVQVEELADSPVAENRLVDGGWRNVELT